MIVEEALEYIQQNKLSNVTQEEFITHLLNNGIINLSDYLSLKEKLSISHKEGIKAIIPQEFENEK